MTAELKPKIWEFRVYDSPNPELVLDYHHRDDTINFSSIAPAIEQIVGVEWVEVSALGNKMRVILRDSETVYNKLAPLFTKLYGFTPFSTWKDADVQL